MLALITLLGSCGSQVTVVRKTEVTQKAMPEPKFTRTHVLRGPEGVEVSVAEFGDDEALFLITGTRSSMEGYALRGKVEETGDGNLRYYTRWDGRDWYPIQKHSQRGGSVWKFFGTAHPNGLTLEYDEVASPKLDTHALYQQHVSQTEDGTLAEVQSFDRAAAEKRADEELAADLKRTHEACGATPSWQTDWNTVSDETLQKFSIASYCENVLAALRNVCRYDPGKAFVKANIAEVECRWGDALDIKLEKKTLRWTVADGSNLEQKARAALLQMKADGQTTLAKAIDYAKTDVCQSPDERHILVVHPHEQDGMLGISYGTSEALYHSPQPYSLSRGWFFDPRQFQKKNNANFRGRDLRYYSHIDVDREKGTCTLSCGERDSAWTRLPDDEARNILKNAASELAPFDREPYALARDARGTYYYVDRGNTEETERDFRVYKGPRGRLKQLEMKDVASDSEGEVFSTEGGELRLLVEKDGASWVHSKKTQKLRRIPVHENYRLIMKELGIYLGKRFELPCDDY